MLYTEWVTGVFLILTSIFLKVLPGKNYIFSLNLENYILFFKKFLENVKLYSGFPEKMNFQVSGNPAYIYCN